MLPGSVFSKAEALVCKVRCFLSLCVYGQPAFPLCILPHLALKCVFLDHQCYVLQTTLLSCLQELSQDSHCPLPSAFCASLPAYFLFTNGHVPSHQNTQSLFISFFPSEILHCNRAAFCSPPSLTHKQYPLCCVAACLGCISAVPPVVCQFLQRAGCCLVSPGAHGAAAVTDTNPGQEHKSSMQATSTAHCWDRKQSRKGSRWPHPHRQPPNTPLVAKQLGQPCWAPQCWQWQKGFMPSLIAPAHCSLDAFHLFGISLLPFP